MKARYVGKTLGVDADLLPEIQRVAKWLVSHGQSNDLAGHPDEAAAFALAFGIVNGEDYDPGAYPEEKEKAEDCTQVNLDAFRANFHPRQGDWAGQFTWIPAVKIEDEKEKIKARLQELQAEAWQLKKRWLALEKN
jgi:hypothetical protein